MLAACRRCQAVSKTLLTITAAGFEGTDSWNTEFVFQRSDHDLLRGVQTLGSYVGLVAPDENNLVKRIITTGGDTMSCQAGDPGVRVDGQVIDDSFLLDPPQFSVDPVTGSTQVCGDYFGPVTVPEGHYFMMGDNRTNSMDSRAHVGDQYQGTIPEGHIRGKVQAVIFPLNWVGGIASVDL